MLINAELLLAYQRCKRKPFLDLSADSSWRDPPSELLLKLQQEKLAHKQRVLEMYPYHQPIYPKGDWQAGAKLTKALMQQGVDYIHGGVLVTTLDTGITLLSYPDLLIKQPGQSNLGNWSYIPAQIELGKRPKLEYQIVAAYTSQILTTFQGAEVPVAWLMLRARNKAVRCCVVPQAKWRQQMQTVLAECIASLQSPHPSEVFIARQRCGLCRWHSYCYEIAKSQQHLSLLPGVTPNRYIQLQALNLTSIPALANASLADLAPIFGDQLGQYLILQAASVEQQRPLLLPQAIRHHHEPAAIELYFDIEAEPDLDLDYLLGVLVVDHQANTKTFHSLIAEQPEAEQLIWQQFLELAWRYPTAPIFHFCSYEVDTVKRLAKLYHTPKELVQPLLHRFVDVYEQVTQTVALPVESYALKSIARFLGFDWRDPQASGSQCIYWYDQWLAEGDRSLLERIQRYNEDDCHATYHVKHWLANFQQQILDNSVNRCHNGKCLNFKGL